MKKQYLIIGLAGLMACNAVSTSYCNNDDIHLLDTVLSTGQSNEAMGKDEMDIDENGTVGVAKAGAVYYNKNLNHEEKATWAGYLPSKNTVIYSAVIGSGIITGLAIAGGLYYLNHTGKLPKMDADAAKAYASKMGSAIGSKFSNLRAGVSDWIKSRMPVNNTIKPINNTLDTTKFCGLNKPQEIVYPNFNSKPVIKTALLPKQVPVAPKTLGSAFANWFKSSKPAPVAPKIFGRFIPNNINPVRFEIKGNPAKPSLGDLFRAKADKVITESKENIGSLWAKVWAKGGKVLSKVTKNIGLLKHKDTSKYANLTDDQFIERAKNFLKNAK